MIGYDSVSRSWYYCRSEGRPIITGFATRYDAERYAEKCSDERRKIDAQRLSVENGQNLHLFPNSR
jgi:hypothetical protein